MRATSLHRRNSLMQCGAITETKTVPGAVWTCPMHTQIRRAEPGVCPTCGMALEPMAVSSDDRPNPEL